MIHKTCQKVAEVPETSRKILYLQQKENEITSCQQVPKSKRPKALEHADYLSLLGKTKTKKRRSTIIDLASMNQVAVIECVKNILQGTILLSRIDARKLQWHRRPLQSLLHKIFPSMRKDARRNKVDF